MRTLIASAALGTLFTFTASADEAGAPPAINKDPPAPICFKAAQLCIGRQAATDNKPNLDLKINQAELERVAATVVPNPPPEEAPVEVKERPIDTVRVPAGILAPFWALRHPTQAWRIFLPVQ